MSVNSSSNICKSVSIQNEWAPLTEVAIAYTSFDDHAAAQLDSFAAFLESEGVVVHRVPTLESTSPRSSFLGSNPAAHKRHSLQMLHSTEGERIESIKDRFLRHTRTLSNRPQPPVPAGLFLRENAVIHRDRVVEASDSQPWKDKLLQPSKSPFLDTLSDSGANVTRFADATYEGSLTGDDEESSASFDASPTLHDWEQDIPSLCSADVIIISPTLFIAQLSQKTNNKGIEYLWSSLSQPSRHKPMDASRPPSQAADSSAPLHTLFVRLSDQHTERPSNALGLYTSPRSSICSIRSLHSPPTAPASHVPLSSALLPLWGQIILYDPSLIAVDEARRLKSVLDLLESDESRPGNHSRDTSPMLGKPSALSLNNEGKRSSMASYGTFSSLDLEEGPGWRFIPATGLRWTSVLFTCPSRAVLTGAAHSSQADPTTRQESMRNVASILKSLGIRVVELPFGHVENLGGGVRDAVLVLRRETQHREGCPESGEAASSTFGLFSKGWNWVKSCFPCCLPSEEEEPLLY